MAVDGKNDRAWLKGLILGLPLLGHGISQTVAIWVMDMDVWHQLA